MKRAILFIAIALVTGMTTMAQKTEVLYFKAQLGCCVARACNALQNDIKTMVEQNYDAADVVFKEVRLNDPANASLVEKFNARSQTVVIVKNGSAESFTDISQEVRNYLRFGNKEEFESELISQVNKNMQ